MGDGRKEMANRTEDADISDKWYSVLGKTNQDIMDTGHLTAGHASVLLRKIHFEAQKSQSLH